MHKRGKLTVPLGGRRVGEAYFRLSGVNGPLEATDGRCREAPGAAATR